MPSVQRGQFAVVVGMLMALGLCLSGMASAQALSPSPPPGGNLEAWREAWFAYEREIRDWCVRHKLAHNQACLQEEMAKHGVTHEFFVTLHKEALRSKENPPPAQPPSQVSQPKTAQQQVAETGFDFRQTRWGMTPAEVRKAEGTSPVRENVLSPTRQTLTYMDIVGSLPCIVIYIFAYGQLARAKYLFENKHTNRNDFLTDYKTISGMLRQKYGTPTKEDTFWVNDLYRKNYQEWGMALAVGHLVMAQQWEMPRTTLIAILRGENYEITHGVEYASKAHKSEEERAQREDSDKKL